MTQISVPLQSLLQLPETYPGPDAIEIEKEMLFLEKLLPDLSHSGTCSLQQYALAYIERYQHDLLQLEHAWKFLYAALIQAWQLSEYAVVTRLVTALAHLVSRLENRTIAEHILQMGIDASRHTHDNWHLASFLNRQGGLLFSHGKYHQGQLIWQTSLNLVDLSSTAKNLWEPMSSFAYIADILGSYMAAQQFAETLLENQAVESPTNIAVAIFIRGFYARVTNQLDQAYEDFSQCLQLLSLTSSATPPSSSHQLFSMVVQSEFARVQGNYLRSQAYTESAISLAQLFSDRYTVFTLLIDQLFFARQQNNLADVQATFLRLRELAYQHKNSPLIERYRCLEQYLVVALPEAKHTQVQHQEEPRFKTNSKGYHVALSEREFEILQLVAKGLSNQEIASQLVITSGTVKKHLEHIYLKLDVHNRTSALARAREIQTYF